MPLYLKLSLKLYPSIVFCFLRFLRSAMLRRHQTLATTPAMTSSHASSRRTPTRRRPCWTLSRRWAGTTCPHWHRRAAMVKAAWRPLSRSPGRWVSHPFYVLCDAWLCFCFSFFLTQSEPAPLLLRKTDVLLVKLKSSSKEVQCVLFLCMFLGHQSLCPALLGDGWVTCSTDFGCLTMFMFLHGVQTHGGLQHFCCVRQTCY